MPDDDRQGYLAYMVRLWRVEGEEGPLWRSSVESPHTSERQAFANLELLIAFLRERTSNEEKRK